MKINILDLQKKYWINKRKLRKLLKNLIDFYKLENAELTLALVDNRTIRKLNKEFLKRDYFTDVLSFPIKENTMEGTHYLGDIVISVPQAFNQCFRSKHGLGREIEILTIHGFLHLIGYDHETDKGEMKREEEKLQKKFLKID